MFIKITLQNEFTCFQCNMVYRDFKDLSRKTVWDSLLLDEVFDIANSTYHRAIKIKPINVTKKHIFTFTLKMMIKIQNLKLVAM